MRRGTARASTLRISARLCVSFQRDSRVSLDKEVPWTLLERHRFMFLIHSHSLSFNIDATSSSALRTRRRNVPDKKKKIYFSFETR